MECQSSRRAAGDARHFRDAEIDATRPAALQRLCKEVRIVRHLHRVRPVVAGAERSDRREQLVERHQMLRKQSVDEFVERSVAAESQQPAMAVCDRLLRQLHRVTCVRCELVIAPYAVPGERSSKLRPAAPRPAAAGDRVHDDEPARELRHVGHHA